MTNIAEILRNRPKGTKVYSPIFGWGRFNKIDDDDNILIYVKTKAYWFDKYGRYTDDGECLLSPSKDENIWFTPKSSHIYDFKPFDKVIARNEEIWTPDLFCGYSLNTDYPYVCVINNYNQCLPYNEETAKLIGTYDEYNE